MKFDIIMATASDSWKVAQRAEALGFDTAWFEDSQMVAADPFVVMAAAAMNTLRIRLRTGVCIPSNRIPPVTANMLATLNALAPGRIDWGVGTGFSGRRAMGLPALSVDHTARYVGAVNGLLSGEFIRKASCSGTVQEHVGRVKALQNAGYTNVCFLVLPHLIDALDDWARVMEHASR